MKSPAYWVDTTGQPTLGIGLCGRCSAKLPLAQLYSDPNAPGLMVCIDDLDVLDPWRLPARETEEINLPFVRPDVPLIAPPPITTPPVLFLTQSAQQPVLNWTPSTIFSSTIVGYQIYRGIDGGALALLTTVGNVLTYTDTSGGLIGHTVAYYVIGVPATGANSNPSNTASEFISTDPFWANVVLMLHMDGTNGSTAIVDSSTVNNPIVVTGSATIETATVKFGTGSMNQPDFNSGGFSGVHAVITQGSPLDILSGTADFTIDGWFFIPTAASAFTARILDYGDDVQGAFSQASGGIQFYANTGAPGGLLFRNDCGFQYDGISFSPTIAANAWHHYALVRHNGNGLIFLDGVLQSGNPIPPYAWGGYTFPTNHPSVAQFGTDFRTGGQCAAYFTDEIRVTAGVARWTANFTPPTSPTLP